MADSDFDAVAAAKELDDLDDLLAASSSATGDEVEKLELELEELNAIIAKQEIQLRQANERADHAHAEIEAAGKRLAGASAKELERRTRSLLESFLSVVDDLDRGITAAKLHAESADVVVGLELVRRSMLTRFAQFGVTPVAARGEKFDPQRHEAIAMVAVTDPALDGHVIDVMREGYAIGDDVLRPAGVAVGRHPSRV